MRAGCKHLICLVCLLAWSATASAQVRSYHLEVDGMSCLFRAFGLERALLSVEAVGEVELSPAEGRVDVTMVPDTLVLPEAIQDRVRASGLTLRGLSATIRGEVYRDLLVAHRTGFTLLPGDGSEHLAKLLAAGARTVEVRGALQRHGDDWALVISSVSRPDEE